jgi:hypothetical protein
MRGRFGSFALVLVATPLAAQQPAPAPAPAPSACVVQIDSSERSRFVQVPQGAYQTYAGGGIRAHCANQPSTTMYSDSLAYYPDRDLLYLIGRVHFRDSVSMLDADRVTYRLREERLIAQGHVYTKNLRTGSDLRGPNLDYLRAAPPIRDTLDTFANGRPTIDFYPASRGATADTGEPFVVVADRARMRGNDRMWGGGHVTVDRSDVAARGDSAQLDLGRNRGALIGDPRVDGKGADAYHLSGRFISFGLDSAHEIRRVVSSGDALARGPDWTLRADTLDLALDSGKVQRAQAWGDSVRPEAVSGGHTIDADSLDIHMPQQIVRLVWAYGSAKALSRDSGATEDDWLAGDSLRADFAVVDSGRTRRSQLEHLSSYGSARALYHVENSDRPQGPEGVNYSRGDRIDITMQARKVSTVDVVGQVDGIYLEPLPPGADTASAADSGRASASDTTGGAGQRPGPAGADTVRRSPARPDTARTVPPDTARAPRPRPAAGPVKP